MNEEVISEVFVAALEGRETNVTASGLLSINSTALTDEMKAQIEIIGELDGDDNDLSEIIADIALTRLAD